MDLTVNGELHSLSVDRERNLLSVLRTELGLTGAKYGCGEGNCGACTVLIDGEATQSCITPVSAATGRSITTVEGLADGDELNAVQRAFVEQSAFQCGYCTPGFVISATALLSRNPHPSEAEVRSGLNGNICRCGAYARIISATMAAASTVTGKGSE